MLIRPLLRSSSLVPAVVIIAGANAYNQWNEHWEHWEHMPPLEERTEYPYQNIRVKNYFWGDGDKVSSPGFYHLHLLNLRGVLVG